MQQQQIVLYPHIKVKLVGKDGNAFSILGAVGSALKKGGANAADVRKFYDEATAGDYNHLLAVVMRYVRVH